MATSTTSSTKKASTKRASTATSSTTRSGAKSTAKRAATTTKRAAAATRPTTSRSTTTRSSGSSNRRRTRLYDRGASVLARDAAYALAGVANTALVTARTLPQRVNVADVRNSITSGIDGVSKRVDRAYEQFERGFDEAVKDGRRVVNRKRVQDFVDQTKQARSTVTSSVRAIRRAGEKQAQVITAQTRRTVNVFEDTAGSAVDATKSFAS